MLARIESLGNKYINAVDFYESTFWCNSNLAKRVMSLCVAWVAAGQWSRPEALQPREGRWVILQSLTAQLQGAPFTQTAARMVWIPGYALLQLPRPGIPRSGHWYRDGMGERPHPTRTPTMLIRAPVVTSPRQLLNSAPRLCQTTLQSWVRSSPVTGSSPTEAREAKPGPHPGNTACSL